jgi:hypothetical protein
MYTSSLFVPNSTVPVLFFLEESSVDISHLPISTGRFLKLSDQSETSHTIAICIPCFLVVFFLSKVTGDALGVKRKIISVTLSAFQKLQEKSASVLW